MSSFAGLRRTPRQWEQMLPEAVANGSSAQVIFALQDAQHDIAVLAAQIDAAQRAATKASSRAGRQKA